MRGVSHIDKLICTDGIAIPSVQRIMLSISFQFPLSSIGAGVNLVRTGCYSIGLLSFTPCSQGGANSWLGDISVSRDDQAYLSGA